MDIEELIFNTYKDEPLIAKKFKREIIEKYHIPYEETRDIFVRINNYQVKKYGRKLDTFLEVAPYSKEELDKIRSNAVQRRYDRRKR